MSMPNLLSRLWSDEDGVILSAELVLIGTLLVIGLVAGIAHLQNAVVGELNDLGNAIGGVEQSYYSYGIAPAGSRQVISLSPLPGQPGYTDIGSVLVGDFEVIVEDPPMPSE